VTWETVAHKAIELMGSKSKVVVEDKSWDANPMLFDMSLIKKEFGLDFVASPEIAKHLEYLAKKMVQV
jgi:hypothetical protein